MKLRMRLTIEMDVEASTVHEANGIMRDGIYGPAPGITLKSAVPSQWDLVKSRCGFFPLSDHCEVIGHKHNEYCYRYEPCGEHHACTEACSRHLTCHLEGLR